MEHSINQNLVASQPLLHELQLGEQLNTCVQQSRRSDFALMLAMLCDDVREQSQFILPKAFSVDDGFVDKKTMDNQTLRNYFDLPEPAPIALKNMQQINRYNQAQLIADHDLVTLHLTNALSPNPLAFRDNANHIASDVLTNTQLNCQAKHAQKNQEDVLNKPLNIQVDSWIKSIQTSVVAAKLVSVAA